MNTGSGGTFLATHSELIISGADTGNANPITSNNDHSDVRGNPITGLLPSDGAESHNQTSAGKSSGFLSQHGESPLMMACPTG